MPVGGLGIARFSPSVGGAWEGERWVGVSVTMFAEVVVKVVSTVVRKSESGRPSG